mgnify:CR=1 FL=1
MRRLDFDEEYDLVRYLHTERKDGIDGILTNIVHVDAQAESCEINQLIEELNSLYERIRSIKPVIDEKDENEIWEKTKNSVKLYPSLW